MKDRSNKKEDQNTNVEFGIEFGDINGAKLIEYPFMNKKPSKKKKK
jgi:hypothetical protein